MRKPYFIWVLSLFALSLIRAQNSDEIKEVTQLLIKVENTQNNNGSKALDYLDQAFIFEKNLPDSILTKLYYTAAKLYLSQSAYDLSLNYYNSALNLQKRSKSDSQYVTLKDIGTIYYRTGDEQKAKKYWSEALAGFEKSNNPKIYLLYNNFAVLEEKKGNLNEAKQIYQEALNSSVKLNDTKGKIMAFQNLGAVNYNLKDYQQALDYFFKTKALAKLADEKFDLAQTYYNIAFTYNNSTIENKDSALYYLNLAYNLSENGKYLAIQKSSAEEFIKIYEREKKYELANFYLHTANRINDEELKKITQNQISQIEFKYQQKLKEEDALIRQKKRNWIYFVSFSFLLLGCIILFLIYKLQKSKFIRSKLQNELLLKKLEEKNKEITQKSIEVLHTNEILDSTHKKLNDLKEKTQLKTQINPIIKELKNSQKGFNLEEFEKVFKETQSEFYKKLVAENPNLTRNERNLCAFLRLNLSTKDISAISGQSQNSINIARHRLRKKMRIDDQQKLINYLIRLWE